MKLLICGVMGKMGQLLVDQVAANPQMTLIGGIDSRGRKMQDCDVFQTFDVAPLADVIIDFSYPDQLDTLLTYALQHHIPLVLATTGYTPQQEQAIISVSANLPIFRSANFSFGVLVMRKLLAVASELLGEGFDIELIEAHHNQKADAPSGTAKMLVKTINDALPLERDVVTAHQGKRITNTIGVHAIRAGAIAGDHTVLYASESESIEISHRALSKEVFAQGALRAATFIANKPNGLYTMDDLI